MHHLTPSTDYTHINITEVRKDLAIFFQSVNEGKSFAVFHHFSLLAIVGPAGSVSATAHAPSVKPPDIVDSTPSSAQRPDILGLIRLRSKAHLEIEANK
jgi:hypothetical protein